MSESGKCGHTAEQHAQVIRDLLAKHQVKLSETEAQERAVARAGWERHG